MQIKITDEIKISSKSANAILKEHLEHANEVLNNIESQAKKILTEQEYDVYKSDLFVDYLSNLDHKAYWLNIVQILVAVWWAAWIIISLRNFLKFK